MIHIMCTKKCIMSYKYKYLPYLSLLYPAPNTPSVHSVPADARVPVDSTVRLDVESLLKLAKSHWTVPNRICARGCAM